MKNLFSSLMVGVAFLALSSCGGSKGSSDGMFGRIPETIEKYDSESASLKSGLSKSNYKEKSNKASELKAETIAKLEKEGEALNGKELAVSVNENEIKIESPLTLVYKNVFSNVKAVEFGFAGKIVAANDLKLEIDPSDLKGREFLGGSTTVVTARLPVYIELLDGDGNIVDTRTIGNLEAENNGEEAIVKAGTPVDFSIGSLPVTNKYNKVESARLVVDLAKGLTSERMAE